MRKPCALFLVIGLTTFLFISFLSKGNAYAQEIIYSIDKSKSEEEIKKELEEIRKQIEESMKRHREERWAQEEERRQKEEAIAEEEARERREVVRKKAYPVEYLPKEAKGERGSGSLIFVSIVLGLILIFWRVYLAKKR